jgi:hypothetical protein
MDLDYSYLNEAIRAGQAQRVVPRWTMDFLGAVAAGQENVAAVRHPLGFLCFPAWRGAGTGVCVHIWNGDVPGAVPTTSGIHAHSWDLVSYVLSGGVYNEIVGVTAAPDRPTHRVFEIHSDAGSDTLCGTPLLVRCQTRSVERYRPGDVYTLPSGVFHTSSVDGVSVTVALGRDRPGAVDRSLGGVHTADHRVHRQCCDPEETRCAAQAVIATVGPLLDLEDQCPSGK